MCVPVFVLFVWALAILTTGYFVGRWRARTDYAAILKGMIDMARNDGEG